MTDIYFYSRKNNNYGWLSNFWRSLQKVDNISYKTNEHYYQSMKAKSSEDQEWIADASTPYGAMKAGRNLRKKDMIDDWDIKKVSIMRYGLLCKFLQNKDLKEKLLQTGDANLHEDSPTDMFWGVKGKDMLGKLLMEIREDIRKHWMGSKNGNISSNI